MRYRTKFREDRSKRFAEKVSWEKIKKKHAQNIRSTVHRTGDLINIKDHHCGT